MSSESVELFRGGETLEARGETQAGRFIMQLDMDSGKPLKLSVPDKELEIEFADFVYLD
jgi:hypothetical protein